MKIEEYFLGIKKKKEKIMKFNKKLIESLEIYSAMIKVKKRNSQQEHFEKVKIGVYCSIQEKKECIELKQIQDEVDKSLKEAKFISLIEFQ